MSVQLGHLSLVAAASGPAGAPSRQPAPAPPTGAPGTAPVTSDVIPASPPPEVQAQVTEALQRAHDLFASNRELHFAKDPETGRIVVQVRDLEGNVVRTIPPSEALEVMTGGVRI
jgi:flagellar protein FlaG